MRHTLTAVRPSPARGTANPFAIGAVFVGAGIFVILGAFGGENLAAGTGGLPLYALAISFLILLLWWECTSAAVTINGVLPRWISPPALLCAWTLAWVYGPATVAFIDDRLLDEYAGSQGGPALLVTGALLAAGALTALSFFYHLASRLLRPRQASAIVERSARMPHIVGLYVLSAAARVLRLSVVGVAYGQDLSAWGSLQWADQWIGYVEDLRYLALAFLVAHIVRHGSGRAWLLPALLVEVVFGATAGFFKPLIWPVIVCVMATAALDRIRGRQVVLVACGAVVIALFYPVVTAIRDNRAGALGSGGTNSMASALGTIRAQGAGVAVENVYLKFFSRQTEVATAPGLVAALTPAVVPYEGVEQFLLLPTKLVPRAIWPDKPVLSRGRWFSVNFRGLEDTTTSSSAMTLVGESYLFFGSTGVLIGMAILGTALAVLYRLVDRPGVAVVYLALLPTLLEVEIELSSYLTTLVQRSLVFIIAFYVLTHRAKAD